MVKFLGIDINAAQVIFNNLTIDLWQVPRNAYRQPIMSDAELLTRVKEQGVLGNHLFEVMKVAFKKFDTCNVPRGEVYIYGDNFLVLFTAI